MLLILKQAVRIVKSYFKDIKQYNNFLGLGSTGYRKMILFIINYFTGKLCDSIIKHIISYGKV
jgi:hypothetical protein